MPQTSIDWEITEAFDKFGFDDGNGANFTGAVVAAIEEAGPYTCETDSRGMHNYIIERIVEAVPDGEVVAEFDGYELPEWDSLPEPIRNALEALNGGEPVVWSIPAD